MSVFSDLKVKNRANRNGFDLGRFSTFSTKAGYILPVFHQITLPSSEYSLDIKQLLRTEPLQKAAFAGFSINYDVIWCPFAHLYSGFNQFIAQREQKNHATQPSYQYIPTFSLRGFIQAVYTFALHDYIASFTDYHDSNSDSRQGWNPSILIREEHMPHDSVCLNVLRQLDMMDYGNLLPILKSHYASIVEWFSNGNGSHQIEVAGQKKNVDFTTWTTVPADDKAGVLQFFHYFGINYTDNFATISNNIWEHLCADTDVTAGFCKPMTYSNTVSDLFSELGTVAPTLFLPLAYNKAFYEYYRNTYYDEKIRLVSSVSGGEYDFEIDYCRCFNLDDYTPGMFASPENCDSNFFRLLAIFCIKPHLYKRDLFTGVLPSTQFGDVSVASSDNVFYKFIANRTSEVPSTMPVGQLFINANNIVASKLTSGVTSNTGDKFKLDPLPAINVLELRKADAMQRFKERMLRAGSRTKDIFAAHGWSEPLSEKSYEPIFLGSFDGRLDINVVAATNEGESLELGQLGANGMATVSGHKVKIKTSDFGVLFVLFHIEKDAVYDSYGLDQQHTLVEPFDYPYPELQNISLAPIDKKYLNLFDVRSSDIIGYLPRAIYAKTATDKVHGEFYSALPWRSVGNPRLGIQGNIRALITGVFSDWVAPREDIINKSDLSFLYVSPMCTDTLFKQYSNVRQDSDAFKINVRFDCYAVEPLPVIGLPQ